MSEGEVQHWRVTYNDIHNLIRGVTPKLAKEFNPDLMVAIGTQIRLMKVIHAPNIILQVEGSYTIGHTHYTYLIKKTIRGFFPARVMRTFLREITENKSLQIQAIGLSLYEPLPGTSQEQIGKEVDEVDDTRKTLRQALETMSNSGHLKNLHHSYALTELKKDIAEEVLAHPGSEREALLAATKFAIFVVHNKNKPKLAELPEGTPYYAGEEVEDVWLDYPWEAINIEEHDRLAASDRKTVA
ncbi:hypothetical protein DXG01_012402 [Tephrocybe rancida]|nr:hypothetical protein DXG01_012402 [Tephrocybe rancida]